MKKAALFGDESRIEHVYGAARRAHLAEITDLLPQVVGKNEITACLADGTLRDIEVVFSTWTMPALTQEQIRLMPGLQAVFYAAGSVQGFARPFLENHIAVFSAWQSNAVPVAEFTLAQILLAGKGYFRNASACRTFEGRKTAPHGKGNYGETVALLGAGAIGRLVIALLKPFRLRVVVFDPFLSEADARALGVEKVSLETAFSEGYVVSNHLANNPQTVKMLRAEHFALLRDDATFINTGRGATVDEDALVAALTRRPALTALLDVTFPEPPLRDSPLYELPNVHLSSHIAGSIADEVGRMADSLLSEFALWESGKPTHAGVSLDLLERLA